MTWFIKIKLYLYNSKQLLTAFKMLNIQKINNAINSKQVTIRLIYN